MHQTSLVAAVSAGVEPVAGVVGMHGCASEPASVQQELEIAGHFHGEPASESGAAVPHVGLVDVQSVLDVTVCAELAENAGAAQVLAALGAAGSGRDVVVTTQPAGAGAPGALRDIVSGTGGVLLLSPLAEVETAAAIGQPGALAQDGFGIVSVVRWDDEQGASTTSSLSTAGVTAVAPVLAVGEVSALPGGTVATASSTVESSGVVRSLELRAAAEVPGASVASAEALNEHASADEATRGALNVLSGAATAELDPVKKPKPPALPRVSETLAVGITAHGLGESGGGNDRVSDAAINVAAAAGGLVVSVASREDTGLPATDGGRGRDGPGVADMVGEKVVVVADTLAVRYAGNPKKRPPPPPRHSVTSLSGVVKASTVAPASSIAVPTSIEVAHGATDMSREALPSEGCAGATVGVAPRSAVSVDAAEDSRALVAALPPAVPPRRPQLPDASRGSAEPNSSAGPAAVASAANLPLPGGTATSGSTSTAPRDGSAAAGCDAHASVPADAPPLPAGTSTAGGAPAGSDGPEESDTVPEMRQAPRVEEDAVRTELFGKARRVFAQIDKNGDGAISRNVRVRAD